MKNVFFIAFIFISWLSYGQNIVSYEYWFDDDFASKTTTNITPVAQFTLSTNVSTVGLNPGVHTISFRSKDNNGKFSSVLTQFFYRVPLQNTATSGEIVKYEYWFDDNYANVISQTVASQPNFNLSALIATSSINTGVHSISIRFKDNAQLWSSVLTQFFYKVPATSAVLTKEIVEYEFWFDDNYAGAVSQTVASQAIYNLSSLISTSSINTGVHSLSIRFKDNAQLWSSVLTQFFYKIPSNNGVTNKQLVAYEYWFDDDYANATSQTVLNQSILNLSSLLTTSTISTGVHTLSIRFKDNANFWSSTLSQFFYKIPNQPALVNNKITTYRYWFDSDFISAVNVPLTAPIGQFSLLDNVDMTQIPHGMHSIHFQFKDSVGFWSSVSSDSIEKIALPIANFTFTTVETCDSTGVVFANNSIDADTYLWDFGGGNTSTLQNPSITFTVAGTYPISLTVTDTILMIDSTITSTITVFTHSASTISVSECSSYTSPSGLYTWTAAGTYLDTIPNSNGCDSVLTIHLILNNTSASISETACFSYTAPDGAIYTNSGQYLATIPNTAGCDSLITIDLVVKTVNVTVTQNVFTFTANASLATYQWLDCNNNYNPIIGETGQTFTATLNGNYAVEINQNGCVDTSICYEVSTISLFENEAFTKVLVYPNPTDGQVNVKFGKELDDVTIVLYDAYGRLISSERLTKTDYFQLEIEQSRGVYFLKINSAEVKTEIKVVKN